MPLALDQDNPAYLLGRLWQHLHRLETLATGDGLGIIGYRKWAATVANPATVLTHHAAYAPKLEMRLRRDKPTAAAKLHSDIAALVDRIGQPERAAITGTEASSWFILGYWHQRNADQRDGLAGSDIPA